MAKCNYCGSTIIMGGVSTSGFRFCNNKCHQSAYILSVTKDIPPEVLTQKVHEVWQGSCPKCSGPGPVDVHKIYQVWSALVLTRWTTRSQVSCRACARKSQLGGAAFSLVAGWWGIPWGLILTPIQISRNILDMSAGPSKTQASPALQKAVLVNIGAQILANQQAATKQSPPPPAQ